LRNLINKIKSKKREDQDLRFWNTYVFRVLVKSGYISALSRFSIKDCNGDSLSIANAYSENPRDVKIFITICGDKMDITKLVYGCNMYGSAIIKRFFKFVDIDIIDLLESFIFEKVETLFDTIESFDSCFVMYHVNGDRLKYTDNSFVLETKDNGGVNIIITNVDDVTINIFLEGVYSLKVLA